MTLTYKHALAVGALAAIGLTRLIVAQGQPGQDVKALYDRMDSLNSRIGTAGPTSKIYNEVASPSFAPGNKLTYRRTVKGGTEFMLVDIATQAKAPAFDHARLAAALSAAANASYTALTLPFPTFTFVDDMKAIEFQIAPGGAGRGGGRGAAPAPGAPAIPRYKCTLTDYTCQRLAEPTPAANAPDSAQGRGAGGGRAGGAGAAGAAEQQTRPSPDGKWEAYIQNYNIFLRPLASNGGGNGVRQGAGGAGRAGGGGRQGAGAAGGNAAAQPVQLSWDGSEGNPYQLAGGFGGGGRGGGAGTSMWSPDSKKIAAYRRKAGYDRHVTYVQSSPTDQVQPKSFQGALYQKPGDEIAVSTPSLFDVETKKEIVIDNTLFPNAYQMSAIQWRADNRAFTFEYNQRGHQVYRLIEVDATTGKARAQIEETSKTFIDYRMANGGGQAGLSDGGRQFRHDINDGREVIWMSERDGWSHLYLYDGVTGQVKNQITKGNWAVHNVDRVDDQARQIYFWANGMDADQDPYFLHYFRINFDGTGLVRYTKGNGQHLNLVWSQDRQYYVDSYSRVDMPMVTELYKASDQSLVMTLEKADATDLLATGWKYPEVFTSKARDGKTDIWGIIIKPTDFDPSKKYPVIENIYAGPQGSFVPKTFSTQAGMQALAELGFIVVQVDGMGTANRSKAFHDVAWKNLGDAGFPDRILWHKAIAAKYPWYDITRVGIYGTSAGGQNSLGGLLFHPEFYKVAVSNSGCHDNRMDKIWWNEQWMGWPIGPEYAASSNTDHAANLKGRLMLVVPELDTNVDPSSTMQVVNALVRASKEFELVVIPGADHGAASPITVRKRNDFFVKNLLGLNPPNWNDSAVANATTGSGDDEPDYAALERGDSN